MSGVPRAPKWDKDGQPANLPAAAEDADEWLALLERNISEGSGQWKQTTLTKLRACRASLRKFLPAEDMPKAAMVPEKSRRITHPKLGVIVHRLVG